MDYSDDEKHALRAWAIGKGSGHHRRTCFACAETRKSKHSRTLSVNVDDEKALWMCFHCNAAGGLRLNPEVRETRNFHTTPAPKKPSGAVRRIDNIIDPLAMLFLKGRGISEATAKHYGVVTAEAYFPDIKRQGHAVAIPYIVNGRTSGHKVRATEEKAIVCDHALSSLCGLQNVDLEENGTLVICEGEIDMLSMYEAGVLNPTSVPNGSSSFTRGSEEGDARTTMSFLWSAKDKIDKAKRIVISGDADEAGIKLSEELARRIGKHRCWKVVLPDGCKDANDMLLKHGGAKLKLAVEQAEPWPVEGLYEAAMYFTDVMKLYEDGFGERVRTGMKPVDELYSCDPGLLTIITGIPGHGKSTFVDQIMINLARNQGWQCAICSFENPIQVHIAKLAEMLLQKHFFEDGAHGGQKMTKEELESALPFIHSHFKFLNQDDGKKATLDSIIERIKTAVFRWGVRGVVIDPYNYIARPKSAENETQWIDDMLTQLRLVAQSYGIHIWFVAHPTKMVAVDGKYPPPRGYSISGSAAWYSKADFGLTIHRDVDKPGIVSIINWKTRFDWMGKEGECTILYSTQTNTYMTDVLDDPHPYAPNGPRTYRDVVDGDEGYYQ